jgi:hypothetical protein
MKIIIYPISYGPGCGGPICLHKLCHDINSLGLPCYFPHPNITRYSGLKDVNPYKLVLNPVWNTPVTNELDPYKDIIIYPEGISGNPLKFKKIVRWILYYPTPQVEATYGKDDLLVFYSKEFASKLIYNNSFIPINRESPIILSTIDTKKDFYKNLGKRRLHDSVLVYKAEKKGIVISNEHKSLPKVPPYQSPEFYLNFFNLVDTLYCYDTASYYSVIAAMCGCKVVVIPEKGLTKEDFKNNILGQKYGIAYGKDDLALAITETDQIKPYLSKIEEDSLNTVKEFTKILKEKFLV